MKMLNFIKDLFYVEKGDKEKYHSLISDYFRREFERVKVKITKGDSKRFLYYDILILNFCNFEIEIDNIEFPERLLIPYFLVYNLKDEEEKEIRREIGSTIICLLKDFARKNNFKEILATSVLNESRSFWIKQGFKKLNENTYYYKIK